MTEKTYNIIMACKRCEYYDLTDEVKSYLSEYSKTPIAYFNQNKMNRIMVDAMYDYIDTCDRPSAFLMLLSEIHGCHTISVGERIARAFKLTSVRNRDGQYVNGFGKWENSNA